MGLSICIVWALAEGRGLLLLQHSDVREWLDHHFRLGVGKVYIFDNSTQSMLPVFADLVRWLLFPTRSSRQQRGNGEDCDCQLVCKHPALLACHC